MKADRPLIVSPKVELLVQDIVEGSLIKFIDGRRVNHRTPQQVEQIFKYRSM